MTQLIQGREEQQSDARPPRLRAVGDDAAGDGAARDGTARDEREAARKAQQAVADLLVALGRDITDEHLADTPRRVAASLAELLTPQELVLTTFPNDEGYDGLVLVRDIPFHSLCQHHLLPFRGVAHIGYVPGPRLVGLSKLARVLELYARDLQVQERLTQQVARHLDEHLAPAGVGVVLEAEHLCMSLRGVQSAGARTTTSAFLGVLAPEGPMRSQFRMSGNHHDLEHQR